MKKLLFVLFACLAGLSLFSCGPKHTGKTVQLPFLDMPSIHPAYWQSQHILAQGTIFEGLYGYEPDPQGLGSVKVVPVIAESSRVSSDGKVWTFKLRKDKKWSNGEPITARDFEWSYKFYCSEQQKDIPLWANALGSISNSWAIKSGVVPLDQLGVKALDDYTLQIRLQNPDFTLPLGLCAGGTVPINRNAVEKDPQNWWRPGNLVCNGPYTVKEWTQGKDAILVKNTNYVGECGNVDTIVLKFMVPGLEMGIQSYQSKELDCAWINNLGQYQYVMNKPELKGVMKETVMDIGFTGYQNARGVKEGLDNRLVREAFAISVNRQILVDKILGGRAVAAYAAWDPSSTVGKRLKPIEFNPERGKKLLAEAGFPGGKGLPQLKFYITGPSNPVAEFVVNDWKKNLGVNVQLENLESGIFNMIIWEGSDTIDVGFVISGGGMNYLSSSYLAKVMEHILYFYDFPSEVRKVRFDMDKKQRNAIRVTEKGKVPADWDELLKKKNDFIVRAIPVYAKETSEILKRDMPTAAKVNEEYRSMFSNWNLAKSDKDRITYWRIEAEALLDKEFQLYTYENMTEPVKRMNRMFSELKNMSWERAQAFAPKIIQLFQEEYYIVPLYFDKAQYLQNPKLSGVMVYKFAWGPQFFNFKYLNLAD